MSFWHLRQLLAAAAPKLLESMAQFLGITRQGDNCCTVKGTSKSWAEVVTWGSQTGGGVSDSVSDLLQSSVQKARPPLAPWL